jgi:hypothetical protein
MRRANDSKWIKEGSTLVGIALGSDFCSEHEWGVKPLKQEFQLEMTKDGIERRIIRAIPDSLQWIETKKELGLFCVNTASYYKPAKDWLKDSELKNYSDKPLVCAWDEKSFGIVAHAVEDKAHLLTLWNAFQAKDVAFWTNIGPFHLGGGLIFCIVSRLAEADKQKLLEQDNDYALLQAASTKTHIEQFLLRAHKSYFALTPQWAANVKTTSTEYPVVYWLNPQEQRKYDSGWFTVEELELWAKDAGPVIKVNKTKE